MKEDAGQFPVPEAVVEAFEPPECLDHLIGNALAAADREDLERLGEEAQHALRVKAAFEAADRVRMGVSFLRPLARGLLLPKDQRADEFIALLGHVVQGQLGGVNVRILHHSGGLPAAPRGADVPRQPRRAAHNASPRREGYVSTGGAV